MLSSNGDLYGQFGVVNASVSAFTSEGVTTRSLNYVIVRRGGDMTASSIVIQHSYSQVQHQ